MQATSNMLWRMAKDGHAAECAMASSPVGVEGQFFIDGRILSSYQFGTESQAVVWAIEKCADLTTRGWQVCLRQGYGRITPELEERRRIQTRRSHHDLAA